MIWQQCSINMYEDNTLQDSLKYRGNQTCGNLFFGDLSKSVLYLLCIWLFVHRLFFPGSIPRSAGVGFLCIQLQAECLNRPNYLYFVICYLYCISLPYYNMHCDGTMYNYSLCMCLFDDYKVWRPGLCVWNWWTVIYISQTGLFCTC